MSSENSLRFQIDGNYPINHEYAGSPKLAVYCDGVFGAASATLSHGDPDGNMVPLIDGIMIAGDQLQLANGSGKTIFMVISGASAGTDITLVVKPIN